MHRPPLIGWRLHGCLLPTMVHLLKIVFRNVVSITGMQVNANVESFKASSHLREWSNYLLGGLQLVRLLSRILQCMQPPTTALLLDMGGCLLASLLSRLLPNQKDLQSTKSSTDFVFESGLHSCQQEATMQKKGCWRACLVLSTKKTRNRTKGSTCIQQTHSSCISPFHVWCMIQFETSEYLSLFGVVGSRSRTWRATLRIVRQTGCRTHEQLKIRTNAPKRTNAK